MGPPITEIARALSMEKFYSTVAKMQKKRMTTPNVWASFRPQNRQEVQILAIFAVKSWEDQIFGARRRCHRTTDKDHAIPVKQGFQPCFFLPFTDDASASSKFAGKVHASKTHTARAPRHSASPRVMQIPRHAHDSASEVRSAGIFLKNGRDAQRKTFPEQPGTPGMACPWPRRAR